MNATPWRNFARAFVTLPFAALLYIAAHVSPAHADALSGNTNSGQAVSITDGNGTGRQAAVDSSRNLQVNCTTGCSATGSATGAAVPATASYVAGNKGGLLTGITLDGSSNLNVNCVVGCSGGTASNASSGVATSSTNGTTNAWLYGYNGASWDQLQVDASKFLKVNCAAGCAGGTTDTQVTGTATSAAVLTNFPVDGTGYSSVAVQFTSVGSGNTVVFEGSNDNFTTTTTLSIYIANSVSQIFPNGAVTPATANLYVSSLHYKYFRVRVSVYSSGTVTAVAQLKTAPLTWPLTQTNLATVAGTTTDTNSGTKSAGTLRVVLATDQPALTNKLLVTPDSVALPANQSVNVSQINAVTPLMGNGVTGTGSQRVTIASDNTAFAVNATLQAGANTIGALTANQSVNAAQIAGNATLTGNGVTGTGSARVTIASDNTAFSVKPTDGTNTIAVKGTGANAVTTDNAQVVSLSPNPTTLCTSRIAVNQTTSTDLLTSTAKLHICTIILVSATAQNISLTEGTGSVCATGAAALIGGTTASVALAANGGFSAVAERAWMATQTTADHLCLLQSGAGNVSGIITYTDHN